MPWRYVYEPAPQNLGLEVLPEPPAGLSVQERYFSQIKLASGVIGEEYVTYTYCEECKGWVRGRPNEYEVNTLNTRRLSGRRGTEYHCPRCGEKIGFHGIVS